MLMRTDPFRELDRLAQQLTGASGTWSKPSAMPMDAWREGEEYVIALDLPGVGFREAYFSPTFSKHTGRVCGGVQVHVTDPSTFDPISSSVEMLVAAKALYSDFAWRYDSYDPARPYWIDKLTGSQRLRTQISAGASADEVVGAWREELAAFDARRQQYLLYNGPSH